MRAPTSAALDLGHDRPYGHGVIDDAGDAQHDDAGHVPAPRGDVHRGGSSDGQGPHQGGLYGHVLRSAARLPPDGVLLLLCGRQGRRSSPPASGRAGLPAGP